MPVDRSWQRADPTDADFRLETSPFYWLTRVNGRYLIEMAALLRTIGMDVPRWRVLMILAETDPASVSSLSEAAVINLSTMTKIVQRMAADGLVATAPRASDARITEVRMTEAGRHALGRVRGLGGQVFRRAFAEVDGAEIAALVKTLETVFGNFDRGKSA